MLPLLAVLAAGAQPAPPDPVAQPASPQNLDFEDRLAGWTATGGVSARRGRAVAGRWAAALTPDASLSQCVPAGGNRESWVRLVGHVRTRALHDGGLVLWIRARASGRVLATATHRGGPIAGTTPWRAHAADVLVPYEAEEICFGATVRHATVGAAWIDELSVVGHLPPRSAHTWDLTPLSPRAVRNLAALGRLHAAVAWFLPSPVDWSRRLVDAVPLVEAAEDDAALTRALVAYGGSAVRVGDDAPPPPSTSRLPDGVDLAVPGPRSDFRHQRDVVIDLRDGAVLTDRALGSLLHRRVRLPWVRRVAYQGGLHPSPGTLDIRQLWERGERVDGFGERGEVWVLTGPRTHPANGRAIAALRRSGQARVIGIPTAGWPIPPLGVELAEGLVARVGRAVWYPAPEPDLWCEADKVLACRTEGAGRLAATAEVRPPPPRPRSPWDRAVRLADTITVWGMLSNFGPYLEEVGTDWNAALPPALARATVGGDPPSHRAALSALVAKAGDGQGRVWIPGTSTPQAPAIAWSRVDDAWVVADVGGFAASAGVKRGMTLIAVDGAPVDAVAALHRRSAPAATEQAADSHVARLLAAGRAGSQVVLTLHHAGADLDMAVPRDTPVESLDPSGPRPPLRHVDGALIVNVSAVTDPALHDALVAAARAGTGVVFDVRGTAERAFDEVLAHLTRARLPSAHEDVPVFEAPGGTPADWHPDGWHTRPHPPVLRGRVAFVADGRTLGEAETLLQIAKQHHLATLFGEASAGTSGARVQEMLPSGGTLTWTATRVWNLDGSDHHGVGVLPDVEVTRTLPGVVAGRDEALEAALAWMGR